MSRKLSRRRFLFSAAAVAGGAALAGCGPTPTATVPPAPTAAKPPATAAAPQPTAAAAPTQAGAPAKYNEAPALKELVQQGKLPPVAQRLPEEPLVMPALENTGKYGGVLRRGFTGPADANNYVKVVYDSLVRWTPKGDKVVPHVAKSVEPSSDFKTWTIKLRKGAKWSDGAPLTADDIMFWYDDVLLNKELTPAVPGWVANSDGTAMQAQKVDEYTVTFTYKNPNTTFLLELANKDSGDRIIPPFVPSAYLKQFHTKYVAADQLKKLIQDAKFDTWPKFFAAKALAVDNPQRPVTAAWAPVSSVADQVFSLKRNPYFIGVDEAGNQLPYIDELKYTFYADGQALNLAAIGGQLDMQGRHIQLANYPVLLENQNKGNFRVLNWPLQGASWYVSPNLTHPDPVLSKLFNDLEFRKGLSLAIDRKKINELVWLGLGVPRQPVPAPWDPYYPGDKVANYLLEYNPTEANRLLDSVGLDKKGADGIRLLSDGRPLQFELTGMAGFLGNDTLELIKKDWEAVGVKVIPEIRDRALLFEMAYANKLECLYFTSDAYPFTGNPQTNVSNASNPICWGRSWQTWYNSGGKEGIAPPDWIKNLTDLHNQARSANTEKQVELAREIYRIWGESLVQIGLIGMTPNPHVVNANMRNVPESSGNDFPLRSPGNTRPELYYYEK